MSNTVALQSDVGNIPSNSVAVLSSLSPLLKALSADNVTPLAVVQAEAIGSCFHINGALAARVPDLLVRSTSMRLQRLSVWVGWMAGDTASTMAQTAGGRAASLISLVLVELYGEEDVGDLLYNLSTKILHSNQNHSSTVQLSQVAKKLSDKLSNLAFGTHLAHQVTRIREVYLTSVLAIPSTFLENLTVETMVDFLAAVQSALQESTSILYVEGCDGIAIFVAVVMALCPNDTTITVEDEIIFTGERRNIVIAVKSQVQTGFALETIVRSNHVPVLAAYFRPRLRGLAGFSWLNVKAKGCLSDALAISLSSAKVPSTHELTCSIAELIASIVRSASELDFGRCPATLQSPEGVVNLLGPDRMRRLREKIEFLFGVEPANDFLDHRTVFARLSAVVAQVLPSELCNATNCSCTYQVWPELQPFALAVCPICTFWDDLKNIVGLALLMLFVDHDPEISIPMLGGPTLMGTHISKQIRYANPDYRGTALIGARAYSADDLHVDLCGLFVAQLRAVADNVTIGVSNGAKSILPSTLQSPAITNPQCVIYSIIDGQFHNRQFYFESLVTGGKISPHFPPLLLPPDAPIGLSALGIHSTLTMTVRPQRNALILRTQCENANAIFDLNFLHLHLNYMSLPYAKACNHNPRDYLDVEKAVDVLPMRVGSSPILQGPIGLFLTHGDPEAQFLTLHYETPILFQANSCLNCVVTEAKKHGYSLIIQS